MPDWLTIVIAVIGLIGTVLGVLGISGYLGERARHKAEKKNRQEDKTEEEIQAAEDKRLHDAICGAIRQENESINVKLDNITKDIEEIKTDLADNTKGTVTLLRNDMKKSLDYCKRQGYTSTSDRANWHELYNTYKGLGGNHFKEFVDAWKEEFDELPTTPPTRASKKKSSNKIEEE